MLVLVSNKHFSRFFGFLIYFSEIHINQCLCPSTVKWCHFFLKCPLLLSVSGSYLSVLEWSGTFWTETFFSQAKARISGVADIVGPTDWPTIATNDCPCIQEIETTANVCLAPPANRPWRRRSLGMQVGLLRPTNYYWTGRLFTKTPWVCF